MSNNDNVVKAESKTIKKVFFDNHELEIPFFQRNYVWNWDEQIKTLINDVQNSKSSQYFLGTVVFKKKDGRQIIIDGQQRITTLLLIIASIHNHANIDENNNLEIKRLLSNINFKSFNIKDSHILQWIIDGSINNLNEAHKQSQYYKNYLKIKEYFKNYSCDEIKEIFKRIYYDVVLVEITLLNDIDPNIIFSKLNSTGEELTGYDMFKNDIMSEMIAQKRNDLSGTELTQFIDEKILLLDLVNGYLKDKDDSNDLLRAFLAFKTERLEKNNSKQLFLFYLKNIKTENFDVFQFFDDYIKFGIYYKYFLNHEYLKNDFKNYQLEIIQSKFKNYIVLLIDIMMNNSQIIDNEVKIENKEEILICFLILEWYILSRMFADKNDKVNTRLIPTFPNSIKKCMEDNNLTYSTALYHELIFNPCEQSKIDDLQYRVPFKDEFNKKFIENQIYTKNKKFARAFLIRLISNGSKMNYNFDNNKTVEHFLPQDYENNWQLEDVNKVNEYIHTIGNLTLTAYNSEYSNSSFIVKKEKMNRNDEFAFNKYFVQQDKWDANEIIVRAQYLLSEYVYKIWNFDKLENKMPDVKANKILLEKLKLEERKQNVISEKAYFEQINVTKTLIHKIIELYFGKKMTLSKIEEELFNKDFHGFVPWSIMKYLGLEKGKTIHIEQFINDNDNKIDELVEFIKNLVD